MSVWHLALKAIPWATILANAARLSEPSARPGSHRRESEGQLTARIAMLEQRDRETAERLTQLTTQVSALTGAVAVLAARSRWLLVASVAASIVALTALGVIWLR
jgi:hypothetical protein